jgi:hypothetical protein
MTIGVPTYYLTDGLGSTVELADAAGTVTLAYIYRFPLRPYLGPLRVCPL